MELWQEVLPMLEKEVTILSYDVWLKTLEPVRIQDSKLILASPSESGREFVATRYAELIRRASQIVNPLIVDVEIIIKEQVDELPAEDTFKIEEKERPVEAITLNPRYNFENFVVGKSNKLAFAASHAVAEEVGKRYNPLFIYGGAGLGKTHLMHAIGNYVRVASPMLKIMFVTSEKFVNDLVSHIGTGNKNGSFRDKYRSADVLMVDDIQFIAGKTATTEEIFHTFNELYSANKQLVFTSDRVPKDIPDIDERLRSRFEWGFTADIQPPDLETRVAILRKKAQILKYNVSMDVLYFMAECVDSNVREMEGLLNKVLMLAQLEGSTPTVEFVTEAAKDYFERPNEAITAEDVIEATCKVFNLKKEDLISKKKTRELVEPRQMCIFVITEMTNMPLAAIGKAMGNRDHATVLYARDKIIEKMAASAKTKTNVENIKNMVRNK
jgi:chromosomal replication initiator protein